jgi:hypothetical protein
MDRLGRPAVQLLQHIGYFRDIDAKRAVEHKAYVKRHKAATKRVQRYLRKKGK